MHNRVKVPGQTLAKQQAAYSRYIFTIEQMSSFIVVQHSNRRGRLMLTHIPGTGLQVKTCSDHRLAACWIHKHVHVPLQIKTGLTAAGLHGHN